MVEFTEKLTTASHLDIATILPVMASTVPTSATGLVSHGDGSTQRPSIHELAGLASSLK